MEHKPACDYDYYEINTSAHALLTIRVKYVLYTLILTYVLWTLNKILQEIAKNGAKYIQSH